MSLILASSSPRRKELLTLLGFPFSVEAANIDEKIDPTGDLPEEIEKLSFRKALAIFKKHPKDIVIGADTIVVCNRQVLGKPKTEENAQNMLRQLSGHVHEVITGVSILSPRQSESFSVLSRVFFQKMTEEEILSYVQSKEPLDKAGAYAIQGIGGRYIKGIEGDYYAIMGLPICELYARLKEYNIS